MLHQPTARESAVLGRFPPERAIAVALVVLLHAFLIWLLLRTSLIAVPPVRTFHEAPITLWLQTAPKKKIPVPPTPETKPQKKPAAPPVHHAKGPVQPPPPSAVPTTPAYNGLRALGRYLFNCSSMSYGALSDRELAHCLGNQWAAQPGEPLPMLGAEPPSIWEKQRKEQRKPARKLEHECGQYAFQSNLGLPCYSFAH